jgi:glutathione peroxidase
LRQNTTVEAAFAKNSHFETLCPWLAGSLKQAQDESRRTIDMAEKNFFDFVVKDAQGKDYPLSQHKGKLVLVVNVASKCGFTPQYEGLEKMYERFREKGLVILGFPCNQFGQQEPGTNEEIQQFCKLNYGVSFPVLAKVDVNGANTAPIYQFLKSEAPGFLGIEAIKWNFTKFLIDGEGNILDRFSPQTSPEDIAVTVEKKLNVT